MNLPSDPMTKLLAVRSIAVIALILLIVFGERFFKGSKITNKALQCFLCVLVLIT